MSGCGNDAALTSWRISAPARASSVTSSDIQAASGAAIRASRPFWRGTRETQRRWSQSRPECGCPAGELPDHLAAPRSCRPPFRFGHPQAVDGNDPRPVAHRFPNAPSRLLQRASPRSAGFYRAESDDREVVRRETMNRRSGSSRKKNRTGQSEWPLLDSAPGNAVRRRTVPAAPKTSPNAASSSTSGAHRAVSTLHRAPKRPIKDPRAILE